MTIHCPEIHHGLYLFPNGLDGVKYGPCCASVTNDVDNDQLDFVNDEYLNKLREENKKGIRSGACVSCWDAEAVGGKSKRLGSLEFLIDHSGLEIFEYNVNWACNLACIMCGPDNSSRWAKELGLTDIQHHVDRRKNQIINGINFNNIKRIHFNGGEPLINDDHVRVLKKIDNISNVKITYNTNGTVLPSDTAMQLWENSHHVRLFFSIDAIGNAFEYIRYPGNWEQLEDNMQWFLNRVPSNVMFGINATIGAYNLLEATELYNWFNKTLPTNREGDVSNFCWQPAHNFDYKHLPEVIKQDALNKLKDCKPLESLYNSVMSDMDTIPNDNWIQQLNEIDSRRGTSWQNSLNIGEYYK